MRNRITEALAGSAARAAALCDHEYPLLSLTAITVAAVGKRTVALDYHCDCLICGKHAQRLSEPKEAGRRYRRGQLLDRIPPFTDDAS